MLTVTFQQFHLKTTRKNDEAEKNIFLGNRKITNTCKNVTIKRQDRSWNRYFVVRRKFV